MSIIQQFKKALLCSSYPSAHLLKFSSQRCKYIIRALTQISAHGKCDGSHIEKHTQSCEDAVSKLAELQSNQATIAQMAALGRQRSIDKLEKLHRHLRRLNITDEKVNNLNVIHITGTKGKGSTAALTESILRHHGYRTGFYSSPHLVNVTERIRLNGTPIAKDLFAQYFWQVYDELSSQLDPGESLPFYFQFLTLVAFRFVEKLNTIVSGITPAQLWSKDHKLRSFSGIGYIGQRHSAFIMEKVDVAILEVGIGGRFDCTNVMSKPICTAVTSLALDHTNILGDKIEDIAWQKAGIFKPGAPAVTINQDDILATNMLVKCSSQVGCPLYLAPPINTKIGLDGDVQQLNAGIAVQLCRIFMDRMNNRDMWTQMTLDRHPSLLPAVDTDIHFQKGLMKCKWPGRYHIVKRTGVTYYFDGAHTADSISLASDWFKTQSAKERSELEEQGRQVKSLLLFNKTGQRSASELLLPMAKYNFDIAVFCSNIIASASGDHVPDMRVSHDQQMLVGEKHRDVWIQLLYDNNISHSDNTVAYAFPTLSSAISWVGRDTSSLEPGTTDYPRVAEDIYLQVFAAGSLYLVGNSFTLLEEQI